MPCKVSNHFINASSCVGFLNITPEKQHKCLPEDTKKKVRWEDSDNEYSDLKTTDGDSIATSGDQDS